MRMENVLVVAAHPDDEVLGVGGTIPLIKQQGGRVTVVIVTDGSSTQYVGQKEVEDRKKEHVHEANEILGTDQIIQWEFPDMRLDTVEHWRLNGAFESLLRKHQFDTVFVQNGDDINLDHQLIYKSVLVATRPVPNQSVKCILSYQVNSSTEWGGRTQTTVFCPNVFIDISATLELKLKAMEVYEDEVRDRLRGLVDAPLSGDLPTVSVNDYQRVSAESAGQSLRNRSAVSGNEVGFENAEAFKLLLLRATLDDFALNSGAFAVSQGSHKKAG